jgi:hypothetical protein
VIKGSLGLESCTISLECGWADNVMVYDLDGWVGLDGRMGMRLMQR